MFPNFLRFLPSTLHTLAGSYTAELEVIFGREQREQALPMIWTLPAELAPWVLAFWIKVSWNTREEPVREGLLRYQAAVLPPLLVMMRESWWIPDGAARVMLDLARDIKAGKAPGSFAAYPELPEIAIQMVGNHNRSLRFHGVQLLNLLGSAARVAVEVAATTHSSISARREFSKIAAENNWKVAHQKLVAGDAEKLELVRRLVLAWGNNRHPDLTHWINIVTQTLPSPPAFDKVSEREAWWLSTAKSADPGLLGQLVQFAWPKQWKDALTRVHQLNRFPPDPRIAQAALQIQEQNPYDSWGSNPFHRAANQLILRNAASEYRETAQHVATTQSNRWHNESIFPKDWLDQYHHRASYQDLSPGEQALIEQARAMVGSEDHTELLNELHTQVYAFPDQDEPRLVLADLLSEMGDPRGEFIQLQCGPQTPANQRKARALLKQHGPRWEAQLPGAIADTVVFERGFPVRAKISSPNLMTGLQNPIWATVRSIEVFWRGEIERIAELLSLPGGASLSELINFTGNREPATVPPEHATRIKKLAIAGAAPGWLTQFPNLEYLDADVMSLHTAGPCPSVQEIHAYVSENNFLDPNVALSNYPRVQRIGLNTSGGANGYFCWHVDISLVQGQVTDITISWTGNTYWHRTEFIGGLMQSWGGPGIPVTVIPGKANTTTQNLLRDQLRWVRPEDLKWPASESTSA